MPGKMSKKLTDNRAAIGREIHDGLAQKLTIACLKLDILIPKMPRGNKKELKEISVLLRTSLKNARGIICKLENL